MLQVRSALTILRGVRGGAETVQTAAPLQKPVSTAATCISAGSCCSDRCSHWQLRQLLYKYWQSAAGQTPHKKWGQLLYTVWELGVAGWGNCHGLYTAFPSLLSMTNLWSSPTQSLISTGQYKQTYCTSVHDLFWFFRLSSAKFPKFENSKQIWIKRVTLGYSLFWNSFDNV